MDELAERLRVLGVKAPGSGQALSQLSAIPEQTDAPDWHDMLESLLVGHEVVAQTVRQALHQAQEMHDDGTADLLTRRLQSHEKTVWMLRATLAS